MIYKWIYRVLRRHICGYNYSCISKLDIFIDYMLPWMLTNKILAWRKSDLMSPSVPIDVTLPWTRKKGEYNSLSNEKSSDPENKISLDLFDNYLILTARNGNQLIILKSRGAVITIDDAWPLLTTRSRSNALNSVISLSLKARAHNSGTNLWVKLLGIFRIIMMHTHSRKTHVPLC